MYFYENMKVYRYTLMLLSTFKQMETTVVPSCASLDNKPLPKWGLSLKEGIYPGGGENPAFEKEGKNENDRVSSLEILLLFTLKKCFYWHT